MDTFDPGDIPLPAFLDPVLDYLASTLPPPAYSFLITLFSHSLAILTALIGLISSLISSKPWEWDAQTILPPLISLLTAYLAILSIYRTTSWMVRSTIWMFKWGAIVSALAAGAGWIAANQTGAGNGVGREGGAGIIPSLTGMFLNLVNNPNQNADTASARSARSRTKAKPRTPRPKAWESFDRHQEWQYNEDAAQGGSGAAAEVQQFVENVLGAVANGGWWKAAQDMAGSFGQGAERATDESGERKVPKRKAGRSAGTGTR